MTTIEQSTLAHFCGSQDFYRHWLGLLMTEGVQYLSENGAGWLADAIASHQPKAQKRIGRFQVWRLQVDLTEKTAVLSAAADGPPSPVRIRQRIEYTDFPFSEITLWVVNGTVMLPSEY